MRGHTLLVLVLIATLALPSFATKEKLATGKDLLFQLEAEFAEAVAKDGNAAFVVYMADDGVELDDGGGISTRDNMRKQDAWPKGSTLTWKPVGGDMAASGDLGYTYGNFVFKSKNRDGQPTVHYGKYTSIWKKQKDGSWKVVVDMGNSSPAPK